MLRGLLKILSEAILARGPCVRHVCSSTSLSYLARDHDISEIYVEAVATGILPLIFERKNTQTGGIEWTARNFMCPHAEKVQQFVKLV